VTSLSNRLVQLLDHLVPADQGSVACHSIPDVDDMVVALLDAKPPSVAVTILASDRRAARLRLSALDLPAVRVVGKDSLRGLWAHLRSAYSISTHGVFGAMRRGRGKKSSTPWHGELSKPIGVFLGREARHFDHVAVSSQNSRILRVAEFYLPPDNVLVIGTPRQATLIHQPRAERVAATKSPGERWVMFVPTFRQARRSRIDYDGSSPEEETRQALADLSGLTRDHDVTVWLRPHPLADPVDYASPGLRLATDEALQDAGLSLYDVLAATDLLISDYSSVWVDYLILDRPVLGFCPDIDEYRRARGLALEPYEQWFPGRITTTGEELCAATVEVLEGKDSEGQRRGLLRSLLAEPRPGAAQEYWSTLL